MAYEPNAFDGKDAEYINASRRDVTCRFVPYLIPKPFSTSKKFSRRDVTCRFVPYCNKIKGYVMVAPFLHYNSSDYYQLPKAKGKDVLTEPYFYEGAFIVS